MLMGVNIVPETDFAFICSDSALGSTYIGGSNRKKIVEAPRFVTYLYHNEAPSVLLYGYFNSGKMLVHYQ